MLATAAALVLAQKSGADWINYNGDAVAVAKSILASQQAEIDTMNQILNSL